MKEIAWFKDPDNVVYTDRKFMVLFGKETGIENLNGIVEEFAKHPTKDGLLLRGGKRTSLKLFVPDLVFDEHLEHGEKVWMYLGENYDCYCMMDIDTANPLKESISYKFFNHAGCEYFPCHPTKDRNNFNCLFCYCPLYPMGRECGGNYVYMENGIKDCSGCMLPHRRENYDLVMGKLMQYHKQLREEGRL